MLVGSAGGIACTTDSIAGPTSPPTNREPQRTSRWVVVYEGSDGTTIECLTTPQKPGDTIPNQFMSGNGPGIDCSIARITHVDFFGEEGVDGSTAP